MLHDTGSADAAANTELVLSSLNVVSGGGDVLIKQKLAHTKMQVCVVATVLIWRLASEGFPKEVAWNLEPKGSRS